MLFNAAPRPSRFRFIPALGALAATAVMAVSAPAGVVYWDAPGGGDFGTGANWSLSETTHEAADAPGADDLTYFTLDGTYNVTFSSSPTTSGAIVSAGNATFDLGTHAYSVQSGPVFIGFSDGDDATLMIHNGTLSGGSGGIALGIGSTGAATVSGNSAAWSNSADLYAGNGGNGTLRIEAGGDVTNVEGHIAAGPNSTSSATVTGLGSTWTNSGALTVGGKGQGTLNVEAAGQASSAGATLGDEAGSSGQATVSGDQSTWLVNGVLTVGNEGAATVMVNNGGHLTSAGGVVAGMAGSSGGVTVSGGETAQSTWQNSGSLTVGSAGDGTVEIADGGKLTSAGAVIGAQSGVVGAVSVQGYSIHSRIYYSNWANSGTLYIGKDGGEGSLRVSGGNGTDGSIGNFGDSSNAYVGSQDAYLGYGTGSKGTATVGAGDAGTGGVWQSANLYIGESSNDPVEGILNLENRGTVWVDSTLTVGQYGTINLSGGTLRFDSLVVRDGGAIDYTGGAVQLPGYSGVGDDYLAVRKFFPTQTVSAGKQLRFEGDAHLWTSFSVDGGHLQVGGLGVSSIMHINNTLEITGGGYADTVHAVIGDQSGMGGKVIVTGENSQFSARQLEVGGAGYEGVMEVSDGGFAQGKDMTIGTHGIVRVGQDGHLFAYPLTLSYDGVLEIGPGGLVTDSLDYTQGEESTLRFILSGTGAGVGVGLLDVDGAAHLDGTLEIELADGYRPGANSQFNLFNAAGGVNGVFAHLDLQPLTNGLEWNLSSLYTSGTLSVTPEPGMPAMLALAVAMLPLMRRCASSMV